MKNLEHVLSTLGIDPDTVIEQTLNQVMSQHEAVLILKKKVEKPEALETEDETGKKESPETEGEKVKIFKCKYDYENATLGSFEAMTIKEFFMKEDSSKKSGPRKGNFITKMINKK